jgi:hypothetical protein
MFASQDKVFTGEIANPSPHPALRATFPASGEVTPSALRSPRLATFPAKRGSDLFLSDRTFSCAAMA